MEKPYDFNVDIPNDDRFWASCCHLSAFAGFFLPFIGHFVAPIIIWLLKRHDSEFIDKQGKEAMCFQLSVTLYGIIGILLIPFLIGYFLLLILFMFWIVLVIVAAIKANDGLNFRYPLCIHFV